MSRHSGPALVCAVLLGLGPAGPVLGAQLPAGFVYLSEVAPDILQDMRYAGPDNFTGRKVSGYDAPQCILRREVAEALKRAQDELRAQSLGLKVYDCYRPARATRAFLKWIADAAAPGSKRYFPRTDKATLHMQGYISPNSAHSRGIAVDLTLVRLPAGEQQTFDPARATGRATGRPAGGRRTTRSTWAPASTASTS